MSLHIQNYCEVFENAQGIEMSAGLWDSLPFEKNIRVGE